MTPEAKIKKAFTDEAKRVGLAYINLIETGDAGNPDKIALPPNGKAAFVEFKRAGDGILSDEQVKKIKLYRSLGYSVFIIDVKSDAKLLARALMHWVERDD